MKGSAALFLATRMVGGRPGSNPETGARGKRRRIPISRHARGAILGIALSLIPFVLVLLVADGMIGGITSRYLETWSYDLQAQSIGPADAGASDKAARLLAAVPGVVSAWPEIRGPALAVHAGNSAPALIRGLDASSLSDPGMNRYLRLVSGRRSLSGHDALVGNETAAKLGLSVGDSLVLVSGGGDAASFKTTIVRVAGIVTAGYRDLDELWIFLPRAVADRALPASARQDLIGIKVSDPFADPGPALAAMEKVLAPNGDSLASPWVIRSWRELESNLFASFETTRYLLLVIMGLSVLVAAANVSSALAMIVLERAGDIAIIKAAGSSAGQVSLVFLLVGGTIGLVGSLLGTMLGALAAWKVNELIALIQWILDGFSRLVSMFAGSSMPDIRLLDPAYYLEKIPVKIDFGELALVALVAMALSMAVSALPAARAARLRPLEILHKT